jgi:pyruvate dehydrogenase E2 component (dihydrolipoamide acetyltransferase)
MAQHPLPEPEVVMPRLSDSMEEGTILKWLKGDGDEVARGDQLVEIETDKATVTFEAAASGTLHILAPEGETVPVGAPIAQIGAEQVASEGNGGRAKAPTLGTVTESGTAKGNVTVQELTRAQAVLARRVAEAKATVPEHTLSAEVDMEAAVALRAQLEAMATAEGEPAPSYNDLVVRACALALREHPRANGAYKDGRFELYSRVNVGVAVAARDGLVVPTVFDADQKTLREIARETRRLAERVRAGTVTPPELSGGTFTVSNLGMFGIQSFTAVINPPQAAILAVGEMTPRPVVRDGEIVARHALTLTLACDHRILYGADAAEFLGGIRGLLEQPIALAL